MFIVGLILFTFTIISKKLPGEVDMTPKSSPRDYAIASEPQ